MLALILRRNLFIFSIVRWKYHCPVRFLCGPVRFLNPLRRPTSARVEDDKQRDEHSCRTHHARRGRRGPRSVWRRWPRRHETIRACATAPQRGSGSVAARAEHAGAPSERRRAGVSLAANPVGRDPPGASPGLARTAREPRPAHQGAAGPAHGSPLRAQGTLTRAATHYGCTHYGCTHYG